MSDGSGEADGPGTGAGAVRSRPVALDLPGTADALERYRTSAWRWFGGGAVGVWSVVYIGVCLDGWPGSPTLGGFSGALLAGGALVRHRARQMRRVLGAGPWVAHSSVALQRGSSGAAVVLSGPGTDELLPLAPSTPQWRFPLLNDPGGKLWWCGDPRKGGVLAPPGGTELIWAKPVRGRRARSIAARPQVSDLRTRPAPPQPQIATGAMSHAGGTDGTGDAYVTGAMSHAGGTGDAYVTGDVGDAGVVGAAEAVTAAEAEAAATVPAPVAQARRRRPWWRGVFRWVFVLGCLLMALATWWSAASDDDPYVDLTVIGERGDGRCVVRWTDPFGGQERTGLFHCARYRASVEGYESGFAVSYPPFKGDLYDLELRGTPAFVVTDVVGFSGLALIAFGAVGGVVRLVVQGPLHSRRLPPHALPDRPWARSGPIAGPDAGPGARPGARPGAGPDARPDAEPDAEPGPAPAPPR
ncbi:hypothetical protein OG497_21120 [Streptomyces sp. NBC_01242]|uniref:hypothetical protein n=1 Tax=Streptomyces sp. NBC_01242 TaxID=2903795 RepID=UPI002259B1B8|nr:hypothetical protein [Streptomyces sp. NBC_01242]MCX4796527.1 hypothetical protein [Streptomyces sp. NBC_01242]